MKYCRAVLTNGQEIIGELGDEITIVSPDVPYELLKAQSVSDGYFLRINNKTNSFLIPESSILYLEVSNAPIRHSLIKRKE